MRKMLIPIALAATLACGFAQAQERSYGGRSASGGDRVDTRQARQTDRIRSGMANGDLTRREASALRSEQRGIRQMERHARADGVVTPREGRRLERAQDRSSRHINQQRHDRQQRAGGWRGHDRGRAAYGRGHNRGNHYAYGHRNNRGNHYAYGHRNNRGNHYAYGHRNNRGNHYAYGHRNNRGNHYAYGHRYNHRPQFASRGGRFGRR